jgi:hypothetical protein
MKHANPLIIDIIDQHECFLNQFNKRKAFYNEKNYKIIRTNNENYIKYINNVNNNILTIDEELWKTLIYKPRNNKNNKNNTLNIDISDTNEHICLI